MVVSIMTEKTGLRNIAVEAACATNANSVFSSSLLKREDFFADRVEIDAALFHVSDVAQV